MISQEQYKSLNEDVFVNGLNQRKKQANLTYDKNSTRYNKGNKAPTDLLKTDKMSQNNGDTYEVPLKGGIMSYNITSIRGTEVMHYFKRKFEKNGSKAELKFKDAKNEVQKYELVMQDSEFRQFVNDFKAKVKAVVDSRIDTFKPLNGERISNLSIYPVPSSSNFNNEMAKILKYTGFDGMNVQIINSSILKKDTTNLQKDLDFINKNKEYYSSNYRDGANFSHEQQLDTDLNKIEAQTGTLKYIVGDADKKIFGLNDLFKKLINAYRNRDKEEITPKQIERIGDLYGQYVSLYQQLVNSARYYSEVENKEMTRQGGKLLKAIKYSKGPSIETRSNDIFSIAKKSKSFKKYGYNKNVPLDVCQWEPISFQIKKLGNDVRMGLKNYFQPDKENMGFVKKEVDKAKNSVVVIFDDNISGGATLSDICLQLKQLGIENIIPITFGEMHQQWNVGVLPINPPKNGFNMTE